MIPLPQEYKNRMEQMLGEEAQAFFGSYQAGRSYGLRYNPLKWSCREFLQKVPFPLEKIEWAEEGYYYGPSVTFENAAGPGKNNKVEDIEVRPGKSALHEAGGYYIQEPSAMAVAECLGVQPGEVVLDLCAAPGGKTTQMAGKMRAQGLLVANEYVASRAKILSQNVERMGICNVVVLNETPQDLSAHFKGFFDRILVDAPCSGEGMFRKDEESRQQWSSENVNACAKRQDDILHMVDQMLKPGGVLVYSTCTFAPLENEGSIARFLQAHPNFVLEDIPFSKGFSHGNPAWAVCSKREPDVVPDGRAHEIGIEDMQLQKTVRLFPHKLCGEGHFIACLRKQHIQTEKAVLCAAPGKPGIKNKAGKKGGTSSQNNRAQYEACFSFMEENITAAQKDGFQKTDESSAVRIAGMLQSGELRRAWKEGRLLFFGSHIYLVPKQMVAMQGLHVVRAGLELGENKKNRFEPSHALALALHRDDVRQSYELGEKADAYLHGETVAAEGYQGWVLMTVQGISIGWGKAANGIIKNHYPKGLRR